MNRKQRGADLFAARDEHVHFPVGGTLRELPAHVEEPVGFARHGAHDHDHLVAFAVRLRHALGDHANPVERSDTRAAIFLYDQGHWAPKDSRAVAVGNRPLRAFVSVL